MYAKAKGNKLKTIVAACRLRFSKQGCSRDVFLTFLSLFLPDSEEGGSGRQKLEFLFFSCPLICECSVKESPYRKKINQNVYSLVYSKNETLNSIIINNFRFIDWFLLFHKLVFPDSCSYFRINLFQPNVLILYPLKILQLKHWVSKG